jgi:hypothetical protein
MQRTISIMARFRGQLAMPRPIDLALLAAVLTFVSAAVLQKFGFHVDGSVRYLAGQMLLVLSPCVMHMNARELFLRTID